LPAPAPAPAPAPVTKPSLLPSLAQPTVGAFQNVKDSSDAKDVKNGAESDPLREKATLPRTRSCHWLSCVQTHPSWARAAISRPAARLHEWFESETGGEGDCLFHCLAAAQNHRAGRPVANYLTVRAELADTITDARAPEWIASHPECKGMTPSQARAFVASPHRYQGTEEALWFLARHAPAWADVCFLTVTQRAHAHAHGKSASLLLQPQTGDGPADRRAWLALHNIQNGHWRLLAHFSPGQAKTECFYRTPDPSRAPACLAALFAAFV
jgi:hypothetical protein